MLNKKSRKISVTSGWWSRTFKKGIPCDLFVSALVLLLLYWHYVQIANITKNTSNAVKSTSYSSMFLPQYVLHIGTEGTGHHFIHTLIDNSPLMKTETKDLIKHRIKVCLTIKKLYIDICKERQEQNPDGIFTDLVEKLREMDDKVRAKEPQIRNGVIKEGNINFHINSLTANSCHLSLPMLQNTTCRNLQFHGIDIFHKACIEANVTCGHVVMFRDSHEILRSTKNRDFGHVEYLVSTLIVKLKIIASEMMMHRDRLIGCFDYNDPSNIIIDREQSNMFGWNVRDGSLKHAIKTFYKQNATSAKSQNNIKKLLPKYQSSLNSMIDSNNMIKQMCMELLDQEPGGLG